MLALHVVNVPHSCADRSELVLRLLPLALLNELLNLRQFGLRGKRDLVFTRGRRRAEQHGAQAVERIAGSGAVDDRAEAADAQQCRGDRADHGHAEPVARARPFTLGQGGGRLRQRDDVGVRRAARLVAPAGEHRRDRIRRRHPGTGGERVEQAVAARDRFQSGFVFRHSRDLPR